MLAADDAELPLGGKEDERDEGDSDESEPEVRGEGERDA